MNWAGLGMRSVWR